MDETTTAVRYPEGSVLLRSLTKAMPVISHGEGIYLFDRAGKRYVDASSGAMVASVGHGNREIADAIHKQLCQAAYINGTQFTSAVTESLASRLAAHAKSELPAMGPIRASFLCSGSEAIEAAVKFARQLCFERGQAKRTKLVARTPSYHGNTLFALSASARPHYRAAYGPLLSQMLTVPAPYPYRSGLNDYARDGAGHYVQQLEKLIETEGGDTIFAFIAEPVIGSSAGAAVPPPGYFSKVRALCDKHGILLIADEVMCGSGRCGTFFASKLVGLDPDLIVLGKGVGGGYAPLSAVLVKQAHVDELKKGSGGFAHAQTYMQAPFVTAAGDATLAYYEKHDLVGNAARVGARFAQRLTEKLKAVPYVGCVQGAGLLLGVELVADQKTRAPFERSKKVAERVTTHLFERGIIVWPNVGSADGTNGDLFMLGPPLTIDAAQSDTLADDLSTALQELTP